jgi:FKBP-type peptidyl-prolyl cis-trans isomerase 2
VLKADGEKLTGTVASNRGESEIKDGIIKGSDVTFSVVRNFGGNDVTVKYKGKLAGDTIQFKVEAGERSYEMTAKRVSP